MKLNEKIKITMDALNRDERTYENLIMRFLAGSGKAAPGYWMEIIETRVLGQHTAQVDVNVFMPRSKKPYACYSAAVSTMTYNLVSGELKLIYYRGSFERFLENERKALHDCYAAGVLAE